MQQTRDSFVPLLVALLIAVAGHMLLLPGLLVMVESRHPAREHDASRQREETPERDQMALGRPMTRTARIAWIPYEDYRELMAPTASPTEQPALQSQAEPVPGAPLELDPTPAAPSHDARPSPEVSAHPPALAAPSPVEPLSLPTTAADTPFKQPQQRAGEPQRDPPEPRPPQQQPPREAGGESARPTSAPRSDRESPLAALTAKVHRISPGQVLTAGEFEVKTAVPDYSAIARASALPRNAVAAITFMPDGTVIEAELLRDSGEPNVDGPVLRSLYRWRITGERLDEIEQRFTLRVNLIFIGDDG